MIRSRRFLGLSLVAAAVVGPLISSQVLAAEPDAFKLMKKSDDRHRLPSEQIDVKMFLQKAGAEPSARKMRQIVAQDDKIGDRSWIRFEAPTNIKGTTFLSVEDLAKDEDEQWLYLPAFRKTRRIGSAELGDRFVGSDIYFEDLKRRHVEDYSYKHIKVEKYQGQACWIIEMAPKSPKVKKESPYGKSHVWLRKDNLLAVRYRIFDKRMKPLKEIILEDVKNVTGDVWRADKTTLKDIQRKHRTILVVEKRKVNFDLKDGTFSRHNLEN